MIISGGVNIYPQETENLLITHPKVMDAAVIGVPNEDLGEEVKAVVQPMDGVEAGPELERELIAFCREHLAHFKCPRTIDFEDELPRLPTGKLYKRLLPRPLLGGPRHVDRVTTIDTNKATITWSPDGTTVTKRPYGDWPPIVPLFRNEQRVLRMLAIDPPPVRVPALVAARRRHELVMEAIDGEPLGPKFPLEIAAGDVDDVLATVDRLGGYRPRRRWFRRFDVARATPCCAGHRRQRGSCGRPSFATRRGCASPTATTARNVLRASTGELVLIDWEWSGWSLPSTTAPSSGSRSSTCPRRVQRVARLTSHGSCCRRC